MIRSLVHTLRCVMVALLALTVVSARPAMMLSHAGEGSSHDCGQAMRSHHGASHSSHQGHHCSGTDDGSCCEDCLCACAVGAGMPHAEIEVAATFTHPVAATTRFVEVVRERRARSLRLPPPIGPPLFTRS